MKTITTTTKAYSFDELSESAKDNAIQQHAIHGMAYDWWDTVYEDAKEIASLFGLEIDNIYFSGFSSQGDGACFEGTYSYKKGGLKAVKEHAPLDTELHEIVQAIQDIQRPAFYRLKATTKQSGHYCHSGCMWVTVTCDYSNGQYYPDEIYSDLTDQLRYFADWIYKRLEAEYAYLTSEDAVKEAAESNEWLFTEEGELI